MAGVQVIKRSKRDPWGDALNGLGSLASGFAGGYMGGEQVKLAKENSAMYRDILNKAFGMNGEGINPNPQPFGGGATGEESLPLPQLEGSAQMNPAFLQDYLRRMKLGGGMGFGGV